LLPCNLITQLLPCNLITQLLPSNVQFNHMSLWLSICPFSDGRHSCMPSLPCRRWI
jgi:hypothetical protein